MTKQEALKALKDGKKITHEFYSPDEYLYMKENGRIFTEDNYDVGTETDVFWQTLQDFGEGWSLIEPKLSKVLFLDIEGVLITNDNRSSLDLLWKLNNENKSKDKYGALFDERCVRWLNLIVLETDCDIVITSHWRMKGLSFIQNMWKFRNLPGNVIDITPDYSTYAVNGRGYEIVTWITLNKPEKYCVVDDYSDMLPSQNFVQTNKIYGLNHECSIKIIEFLK